MNHEQFVTAERVGSRKMASSSQHAERSSIDSASSFATLVLVVCHSRYRTDFKNRTEEWYYAARQTAQRLQALDSTNLRSLLPCTGLPVAFAIE